MAKHTYKSINEFVTEIPKGSRDGMLVPARIYATDSMRGQIDKDRSVDQLVNVAMLPGIVSYALAMPDMHEGYGFPIGGVAAFDVDDGIISPGGVGYDINCGVRMLTSDISEQEIMPYLESLGVQIEQAVPNGVGKSGDIKFKGKDLDRMLEKGSKRAVELGYGTEEDLRRTESGGMLDKASADDVSDTAKNRGFDQLGTLGAGNHFIEVEAVDQIYDEKEAQRFNLTKGKIVVLVHTGSRGMGHQIATDYIKNMTGAAHKFKIELPDRELACAPFSSEEGQRYFRAMCAGANYAWANRQIITWELRRVFEKMFGPKHGALNVLYDVAHNIAKVEEHKTGKPGRRLVVHRKGATRSFPGDPVLIPGSMGTGSFLLVGQERSMQDTFGSSCHGAGRLMSRTQARRTVNGNELRERLNKSGIIVKAGSMSGLAEEAPEAYKNADEVVEVVDRCGIASKVAHFKPLLVIKG